MVLDEALEERIAAIVLPLRRRWPHLTEEAIRASNRKQAVVPAGATVIEPVGTAPALVVPPAEGRDGPTVVVLPGPPRELQPMWQQRDRDRRVRAARSATRRSTSSARCASTGCPESEIATTLREAEHAGVALEQLEITTCVRSGELEIVTRFEPRGGRGLRAPSRDRARTPRRHAVLRRRLERSTSRSRGC